MKGHPTAQIIWQLNGSFTSRKPACVIYKCWSICHDLPKKWSLGEVERHHRSQPKAISTHCPPHRLILAAKEGQRELPNDVEKIIYDTLFFFKDSPVRQIQKAWLNLIVLMYQLSSITGCNGCLADCVARVVQLLPLLVRYFEEQALDTANRARC